MSTSTSSSSAGVQMTTIPVLSASQLENVMSSLKPLIQGQSLQQLLMNMPVIVETSYGLVQSALASNPTQISATVVSVIQGALMLSPLPAADVTVLDTVVANLVPSMVSLVAKYLPEVEQEIETGCTACCTWLKSKLCCC
jgi:hypothetical protein